MNALRQRVLELYEGGQVEASAEERRVAVEYLTAFPDEIYELSQHVAAGSFSDELAVLQMLIHGVVKTVRSLDHRPV